ncbi:HDIG domain-containing metalloprotein [Dysgonomonas sp. 511]|uniref:HDIG domain-containing metalloprotein n=1 Tax=Dysgonomonas sp. 511 TaxID=2302930 RepID=UPI0013D027F5|nr:HDIG domain-containing metalloprotein [Dysgonomonas sp. 511]NDV79240.1 HDIG domain-containing protein [Dysgonomonas sp. 511]
MNTLEIIGKFYIKDSALYDILISHSTDVARKALAIAEAHPELHIDAGFVAEAAMLHDIGIYLTDAPKIQCFGKHLYLCHGYLGRDLLDGLGYPKHALVCERHTGVGLTKEDIEMQNLPLPHRDMVPLSIEEKLICFSDCFFSKTKLGKEKTTDEIKAGFARFGEDKVRQFEEWERLFL